MGRKASRRSGSCISRAALTAVISLYLLSLQAAIAGERSLALSPELPRVMDETRLRVPAAAPGLASPKQVSSALPGNGYTIAPLPAWVKPTPAFDPALQASGEVRQGYHARLQDFQYNGVIPGQSGYFNAVEYVLSNSFAVENHSAIEIAFDPSYERLSLHELWIKRGDELIDKLPSARLDLLRTESDRLQLIYDGTRTLAIVMDDVRSGDMVRYAYSVDGENPIFAGNREFRVHTELWSPLDRQYTRILTSPDRPLNRRVRGGDIPVLSQVENGVQELIIDQRGVPEFNPEEDVPSWHHDRGTMVFSDMKDWRSVVEWALPMYQLPPVANTEIATIASVIRTSYDDLDEQIGAALRWVQEEIRYFGVELGRNSHWPSRPQETLSRRYGDCKDKTLLLMALLEELGIKAQAALVNTRRGLESASYPYRLHAFDHVIVHVKSGEESHFIDPTRRNQSGALGQMYEPDYGRALILAEDSAGLSEMGNRRARYQMTVHKSLTLPGSQQDLNSATGRPGSVSPASQRNSAQQPVTLKVPPPDTSPASRKSSGEAGSIDPVAVSLQVVTSKTGRWAESVRHGLDRDGVHGLGDAYLKYYQDYFGSIAASGPPTFGEEPGNTVVVTEQYRIPEFWNADRNVERYRWVYADDIIAYLDMPERISGRRLPYEIVHPIMIEETWDVLMGEAHRVDDLEGELKNDWMNFSKTSTISEDGTRLSVTFRYQTLKNEVAAERLADYADAVTQINSMASFYIEDEPSMGAAIRSASTGLANTGRVHPLTLLAGLLVGLLVTFRRRHCRAVP
ncbi:MAG: DUF3857 domain-containing protein [Granulosicoccus sp.]|nr:DUF3857 domain-containing protein [Granulosicoccus sp.]